MLYVNTLFLSCSIVADNPVASQILVRQRRYSTEELTVTTPPNKWPGKIKYVFMAAFLRTLI